MNRDREILLEVGDNALLVANGGRAFSRRGVISICASHLSDKRLSQPDDDVQDDFDGADEDLVGRIRERELETYRRDRNRITSDYRGEDETSRDYGGRFLWELLQNAADAMGDARPNGEFIGSKGLGFKAVLEVTDTPEIHSGPFHFRFSAVETQDLLRKEGLHDAPPPLTFRIPHTATPHQRTEELLNAGYTTVIRLPLKDDAPNTVIHRLQELDPLFMLLVPQLSTLRIVGANGETVHRVHRVHGTEPGLADGVVRLTTQCPSGSQSTWWRRWIWTQKTQNKKCLTAAICLPLAKGDKSDPVAHCQTTSLFVFFPTQHDTKMRAVVHASFDLEHSRKYTRKGDHDDEIERAFEALLRRVIQDVPVRTVLDAFVETRHDDQDANLYPANRLRQISWSTVSNAQFVPTVGGLRTRPREVRLWGYRLGRVLKEDVDAVRDAHLLAPGLRSLGNLLRRFDAKKLSKAEYIDLLRHCRNQSVSQCVLSWLTLTWVLGRDSRPRAADRPNWLQVPCWWTEGDTARPLAGDPPVLLYRPDDWPDWLKADILHADMRRAIESRRRPEWMCTRVLHTKEQYCNDALYPDLKTWTRDEWCDKGWEVLDQLRQWYPGLTDADPWIPKNQDERTSAVNVLRVPTNKGWLPPADCYASHAWGGLKAFDRYFANIPGRGLLLPLARWPQRVRQKTVEGDWKPLFQWLGVSWEPKVRAMDESVLADEESLPPQWRDYRKDISCTRWKHDLIIEEFPQCIDGSDVEHMVQAMLRLAEVVEKQYARYFYYTDQRCKSFASYQLRNDDWLPCTPSLLHCESTVEPVNAFMPGCGFKGLLPEVVLEGNDPKQRDVLEKLGVKSGLPDDPDDWHHWMRRLSEVENRTDDREQVRTAADELYRRYLELEDDTRCPSDIRLPCLSADRDGPILAFAPASAIYYVDEPHLHEVRDKIIQNGYKLFILSLEAGSRAVPRLGISLLSSVLNADVQPGEKDVRATEAVLRRYRKRRMGLTLAAKLMEELPQELSISVVKDLQVVLVDREKEKVASVPVPSWRAGKDRPLFVDQQNQWYKFGHGLARWVIKNEKMATLFESLLREPSRSEYERRLLDQRITTADVERAMASWSDGSDGGQDGCYGYRTGSEEVASTGERRTEDGDAKPGTDSINDHQVSGSDPNSKQSGPVNGRDWGVEDRPPPRTSPGRRPDVATGRAAEDWLAEQLKKHFRELRRRDRDSKNRESDFVIRSGSREYHIEVKHLARAGGVIYWSKGECEKAQEIRHKAAGIYFMALLVSDLDGQYKIYWSWDPLAELQNAPKQIQWEGQSKYEAVESDSWQVADQQPENVPVERYMFRINVDKVLSDLDEDDQSLPSLRKHIRGNMK